MAINMQDYSDKLRQVQEGIITEDEWILYCQDLLCQVLDDAKDVMIRMKQKGD